MAIGEGRNEDGAVNGVSRAVEDGWTNQTCLIPCEHHQLRASSRLTVLTRVKRQELLDFGVAPVAARVHTGPGVRASRGRGGEVHGGC